MNIYLVGNIPAGLNKKSRSSFYYASLGLRSIGYSRSWAFPVLFILDWSESMETMHSRSGRWI